MEFIRHLISGCLWFVDWFMHLDVHLAEVITTYGTWTYALLFGIVFCETGLVVTPILPGDSLLFAAGTFAGMGSLDIATLFVLLTVAAVLGDAANYTIGLMLGPKVLTNDSRIFRKEYLDKTHRFYERYGGKTIILARFIPIVRTFAPFLAGVGKMSYVRFAMFNVVGAVLWISVCLGAGYFFGGLEAVRKNFTLVVFGIIFVSVLPAAIEILRSRRAPV